MKLQSQIFLWIGSLFILTMLTLFLIGDFETKRELERAKEQAKNGIREFQKNDRKEVASYIQTELFHISQKIDGAFNQIQTEDWWRNKFLPYEYNYRTNLWSNSSVLLANFSWIDFVQTTIDNKLTSLITIAPPFTYNILRVIISPTLSVFITTGTIKDPETYFNVSRKPLQLETFIGVPYWSNRAIPRNNPQTDNLLFHWSHNKDYWLLFPVESILKMNENNLEIKDTTIATSTLEPTINIHSNKTFQELENQMVQSILSTKKELLQHQNLLKTLLDPGENQQWIQEQIYRFSKNNPLPDGPLDQSCIDSLCNDFSLKNLSRQNLAVDRMNVWQYRNLDFQYVWQLGFTIATGIWDFSPFRANAPYGICSFETSTKEQLENLIPYAGSSIPSWRIFSQTPFALENPPPLVKIAPNAKTSITPQFEIMTRKGIDAVYVTKTMFLSFDQKPKGAKNLTSLTIGENISLFLQQLAIGIEGGLLYIDQAGFAYIIDNKGMLINFDNFHPEELQKVLSKKEITIQNIQGQPYTFYRLFLANHGKSAFYFLSVDNKELSIIDHLNQQINDLIKKIGLELGAALLVSLILALIILNQIIGRIVKPIKNLVIATKKIGDGNLEAIHIPDNNVGASELQTLCQSFTQMVEEMKTGRKVRGILNKVVPKNVADKILHEGISVGGELRDVAVLFADIRHFTDFSEKMDPRELLVLLNECLEILSNVIDRHEGVIDKYLGDAVMALFGAPLATENPAKQAVLCAGEMIQALDVWNEKQRQYNRKTLDIGIGINIGQVVAGNVGSQMRLNYTVLGHNVNIAARICDLAKEREILISRATKEACLDLPIQIVSRGKYHLQGISEDTEIFSVEIPVK